ncbi:MAG: ATP-binding protein [Pseudomonadota bacterium]
MTPRYKDFELSTESVSVLIQALSDRNLLPPEAGDGAGKFIRWSTLCQLLDIAVRELGEATLKSLAASALDFPRYRARTRVAKHLLTIDDAYRFMLQARPRRDFPHISAIISTSNDLIDVHAFLDEDAMPSRNFFLAMEGAFDRLRELYGVEGRLFAEVSPTHGHYRLVLAPSYAGTSRFTRWRSELLLSLLSLPNLGRIREVLDARTLRLQEELAARREAEARLEKSEEVLLRRIENIRDLVFEFDAGGGLEYVSPNVAARLGYLPTELRTDPGVIFPAEHKLNVQDLVARPAGSSGVYQLNLVHRNGQLIWHEISSSVFEADGARHVLLVARDISERRQLDADRLNAQKLESLGVLAGTIAHDFNNLLVPILGNVEMMMEEMSAGSMQYEVAQRIQASALKASELSRQLLVYAGDKAEQTRFDLSAEMRSMLKLIRASIPRKIRFHSTLEEGLYVYGDVVQLRQAVMNLLANATESLGMAEGDVTLTLGRAGERVQIIVSDTGPGLNEDELRQAFVPLYSTKIAGRGLGLPAVQAIVKAHNGEVVIESRPGEGTRVKIWLPLAGEQHRDTARQSEDYQVGNLKRVLLLDDEEDVRRVAELYLARFGMAVTSFGDPEEAIAWYGENCNEIDLVMLDLMMPKRNGLEVLRDMRRDRPELPALLVTGFGADIELDQVHDTARTTVLRKPYRREDLVQALDRLFQYSRNT